MTFLIHHSTAGDVSTVRIRGELDTSNVDTLTSHLNAVLGHSRVVIIDLADVTFMDCHTLGVLIGAATRATDHEGWLVVADPIERVRLLLDFFDAYWVIGGHDSVAGEQRRAHQDLDPPPARAALPSPRLPMSASSQCAPPGSYGTAVRPHLTHCGGVPGSSAPWRSTLAQLTNPPPNEVGVLPTVN